MWLAETDQGTPKTPPTRILPRRTSLAPCSLTAPGRHFSQPTFHSHLDVLRFTHFVRSHTKNLNT